MTLVDVAPVQEYKDVMDMNFFGCVRLIHRILPLMKKQQSGRIINVSSVYGLFGL